MQIKIHLKQIGKRKNAVKEESYVISDGITNLRELITDIVSRQVEDFNQRVGKGQIIDYLTAEDVKRRAETGKVAFGELAGEKKQEPDKAIDNALQSFEDGIYCVFIDGEQKENLDDLIDLTNDNVLTFVRLTMLAGRMW